MHTAPGGVKGIVVYGTALNCLTLAYKQNKNNCYTLKLLKDRLVSSSEYHYIYAACHFQM